MDNMCPWRRGVVRLLPHCSRRTRSSAAVMTVN